MLRYVFECDNCKILAGILETDYDKIGKDKTVWSDCPSCRKSQILIMCKLDKGDPGLAEQCVDCNNRFRCITNRGDRFFSAWHMTGNWADLDKARKVYEDNRNW